MHTRKDYLDKKCTHREYYSQFVTDNTKDMVLRTIPLNDLLNSNDEHLNDIPLKIWDCIGLTWDSSNALKEAKDHYTIAGAVCVNKEAARQIIEKAANTS